MPFRRASLILPYACPANCGPADAAPSQAWNYCCWVRASSMNWRPRESFSECVQDIALPLPINRTQPTFSPSKTIPFHRCDYVTCRRHDPVFILRWTGTVKLLDQEPADDLANFLRLQSGVGSDVHLRRLHVKR